MATTSSVASSSAGTLDVPALVSQLMGVERRPIDKLNTQVTSYQSRISSMGTLKGLVSGFQSALQGLNTNLQGFSAASSDSSIFSASATSTAAVGNYSLAVTALAQSQNLTAAGTTSSNTAIGDGVSTTVTFDFGTISGGTLTNGVYTGAAFSSNGAGTKSITVDSTNNTLQGIRDAINTANVGITATIVNDGSATPYRLSLTSNSSGVSNSLKISTSGGDGTINSLLGYDPAGTQNLNQAVVAQNANFTVNGLAISKASNTVTDAIQGVTVTLNKLTTTTAATLTVTRNTSAISTAVSGFVDAYNALASQLKSRSAYGNATTPAGSLAGDGTVRLMQDQLRGILMTAPSGGILASLAQVGITSQADGTLRLDSGKLNSAMTNNFSDVTNLFSGATGFVTRLDAWSTSALTAGGLIDNRIKSLNTRVDGYNHQISQLETRMTTLQKLYTTQYSNLNMVLSSMNSTSAYLTQQLSKTGA
jgi:flagellar hook-associated protein 2